MIAPDMQKVLNTAIALSTEKDKNKLLDLIITEAMAITHADAGTLYIYSTEENCLYFKIMRNHSMNSYQGGKGEEVNLPPVPMSLANVCTHSAMLRKSINIPNVYCSEEFDFSGPKKYDRITGYKTQSMLVIPFVNSRDEIIGVLQLMNCQDSSGEVIAFSQELEIIIAALASQAAVALTNSQYLTEIKDLFQSFVRVMISAIDEMSPYNVNHTRKMVNYIDNLITYLNQLHTEGKYLEYFDDNRREQLIMSAWMHDIGKMVTPLEVMNKPTRLAASESQVLARFDLAQATLKIACLQGELSQHDFQQRQEQLLAYKELVEKINQSGFLSQEHLVQLNALNADQYQDLDGKLQSFLTQQDYENLAIPQGTLTPVEKSIMQSHVKLTAKLLGNITFSKELKNVPLFAAKHHECLDGSGYPQGLKADEIPLEARILSVVDVFEALTSADRPYKKPMPVEKALLILADMAKGNKLDGEIVSLFSACFLRNQPTIFA